MTRRHLGLYFFFGLPIAGALAGSYLHLAAWLRPWMPPGWERLSWVSAMSMDGLIFAPVIARQIVGSNVPGLSLRFAQGIGIVSSVYVNARWGWATMPTGTLGERADILMGAAILPFLVLVAELAMRASLGVVQGQRAGTLAMDTAADTPDPEIRTKAGPPAPAVIRIVDIGADAGTDSGSAAVDRGRGQKRRTLAEGADIWRAFVDRGITEPADIAAAVGVDQKTVRRWRAAAE